MKELSTLLLASVFIAVAVLALVGLLVTQMPPDYAISLAAFPLGGLISALVLGWRGQQALRHAWSQRLLAGFVAGIGATLVYDGYRVAVRYVLAIEFDPFRVQPVFGQILTGLPSTHLAALLVGWGYHLWIGVLLGMLLAVLRPQGGIVAGALFAVLFQLGRWAMYPDILRAGFSDREFFANGVVGQILWGMVAGLILYRIVLWRARHGR